MYERQRTYPDQAIGMYGAPKSPYTNNLQSKGYMEVENKVHSYSLTPWKKYEI